MRRLKVLKTNSLGTLCGGDVYGISARGGGSSESLGLDHLHKTQTGELGQVPSSLSNTD